MKIIFFLSSLFFPLFLLGQVEAIEKNIHGFVVDQNGLPLPGATIIVKDESLSFKGTLCNENGYFELDTKETLLEIRFLGYRTLKLNSIEVEENSLIVLEENVFDLETVVVTEYTNPNISFSCGSSCSLYYNKQPNPSVPLLEAKEPALTAYPNPTFGLTNISTPEAGTLQLYSIDGRLLEEQATQSSLSQFDLSQYAAGLYILAYQIEGKRIQNGSIAKQD